MARIVQQGRGDQLRRRASPLGQGGGLEHVLGLGHRLAGIFAGALGGEEVRDDAYRVSCGHAGSFLRVPSVAARSPAATAGPSAAPDPQGSPAYAPVAPRRRS